MDEETGKEPSDTKITAIKTSQTDFSLCEGKDDGAATVDSKVEEGSQGRGDFTHTSQQINGEHSRIEDSEQAD